MKKIFLILVCITSLVATACEKSTSPNEMDVPDTPRTDVPQDLRGNWMYGQFSMTEYWSQNPSDYIGNALEFAIAFQFNANGTYIQYFTSSSVIGGVRTYQQSVSKGTVEVNEVNKTIKTYPSSAHYKRTRIGQTLEERDLAKSELSAPTSYNYTLTTEGNGVKSVQLLMQGTANPLTFVKKQ